MTLAFNPPWCCSRHFTWVPPHVRLHVLCLGACTHAGVRERVHVRT